MKKCPNCSSLVQFKEMTGVIYGFIPSCNKNTYECTNCKKTIGGLNWFLIFFYFCLGTLLILETFFLGFKLLPLPLNLFNLLLGTGAFLIIIKGFRLRITSKQNDEEN
ncbi:signal transduction histidine kinase [Candidatus Scalindua japonica]|uniref:Signal transduction histidine kinase n=1 Tax=Candidatus Scalindua japonica TaxID=1284222 RepID=A0A286TUS5_9BACT|nr:signal transduction histidine kinase [Candidatus Scalindua japonica]